MLVVHAWGGLGNQLFQYSFYEFLKHHNEEVYLDLSSYQIQKYHYGWELDKLFDLHYDKYSGRKFPHCDRNSILYRACRKFLGIRLAKTGDFYEKSQVSLVPDAKFEDDIYFDGFWQGAHYVQQVKDLPVKMAFREFDLKEKNQSLVEFIRAHNAVSIHVRRGDYLKHPEFFDCCDERYYAEAVRFFQENLHPDAFVFFSDDIVWCRETYGHLPNVQFVDWNTGEDSYLDLYLMSLCSHNIIANSTFSWWAAYLNKNPNKQIVLPKMWKKNMSSIPYTCEGWFRI